MIYIAIIALLLYALRGLAEYLVSADSFGWRVPSWYSRTRASNTGWWSFRDDFHMWQFVRNRAANIAAFLCGVACVMLPAAWYMYVIAYAASELLWLIGHGATFSLLARYYRRTV